MPTFQEQLKIIETRRQTLADASAQYYKAKLELQRETGPTPPDKTPRELLPAEVKKVAKARTDLINAIKTLHDDQGGLTALTANLDDNLPVLLFPVRIETVFEGTFTTNPELLVRVYPDDIHQHRHEGLLRARHPDIRVEVITTDENLDLLRGDADLALRFGNRPTQDALIVRHLMDMEEAFYASQEMAERCGLPATIAELCRYPLVLNVDRNGFVNNWVAENLPEAHIVHRANTLSGLIASVRSGIGASVLPCVWAK